MSKLIGIDIGTSSSKVVLIDTGFNLLFHEKYDYDIDIPKINQAEQNPEKWWEGVLFCFKKLHNKDGVCAIGLSGQMHGLVAIDKEGKPVFPAIIWPDRRAQSQVDKINKVLEKGICKHNLFNSVSTGFLLPSLLWIKENEPEKYKRIYKVMLPKDYIRYKLTGTIASEHSDACATSAYDFKQRDWDYALIEELGIDSSIFPPIKNSTDIAGAIKRDVANILGISTSAKVVFGGSDHSMQLIGNSIFHEGILNSNIGTGSQVSITYSHPVRDDKMRVNTFCHGMDSIYSLVGASLNGGAVIKWANNIFDDKRSYSDMDLQAEKIPAGSEGLVILPYLNGERSPHNNSNAKGIIFGLSMKHTQAHILRAAMEGVVFCLKDILEIFKEMRLNYSKVIASGGGASSKLLLQMQADIFESDIYVCDTREQAAVGAAIIAGLGTCEIKSVSQVEGQLSKRVVLAAQPDFKDAEQYSESYKIYKELYAANQNLF